MELLIALVKEFGPYVAIIAFFIYRDYKREGSQSQYLHQLVNSIVDISTKYNTTARAVISATNKSTKLSNKTYSLLYRHLKDKHPSFDIMNEDSDDDLSPSEDMINPDLATLNLNLIPKEFTNATEEFFKTKR